VKEIRRQVLFADLAAENHSWPPRCVSQGLYSGAAGAAGAVGVAGAAGAVFSV